MKLLTGNFILMGALLCGLQAPAWATGVYVNGHHLSKDEVANFNQAIDGQITPGKHWYDAASGLWGYMGGDAEGQIRPGLPMGDLPADASNGGTGVYLNGRQLGGKELLFWVRLYGIQRPMPGHYVLASDGMLSGIDPISRQAFAIYPGGGTDRGDGDTAGNNTFYRGDYTDSGSGSQGGCSYVVGDGYSASSGC